MVERDDAAQLVDLLLDLRTPRGHPVALSALPALGVDHVCALRRVVADDVLVGVLRRGLRRGVPGLRFAVDPVRRWRATAWSNCVWRFNQRHACPWGGPGRPIPAAQSHTQTSEGSCVSSPLRRHPTSKRPYQIEPVARKQTGLNASGQHEPQISAHGQPSRPLSDPTRMNRGWSHPGSRVPVRGDSRMLTAPRETAVRRFRSDHPEGASVAPFTLAGIRTVQDQRFIALDCRDGPALSAVRSGQQPKGLPKGCCS